MSNSATGQCLCGAVTIKAPIHEVDCCHCGMCRRWSGGGAFMALHVGQAVEIQGSDNITRFASSDWAERGFCSTCGTNLFYYLIPAQQYMLSAGLFSDEDQHRLTFNSQIYVDHKPAYYSFANETKTLTEAEVLASFGVSE